MIVLDSINVVWFQSCQNWLGVKYTLCIVLQKSNKKKTPNPKHFCVTSTFILAVHINYHLQYLDKSWNKQKKPTRKRNKGAIFTRVSKKTTNFYFKEDSGARTKKALMM